jgi:hypothetical protein
LLKVYDNYTSTNAVRNFGSEIGEFF